MFVVEAETVVSVGLEAVLGRLEAACEAIERFYGSSLEAPTRWDGVTQRLADRGASSRTRYDRHAFAAEILAVRLADAARRADELFQGMPARIRSGHLDEFLRPFEEQGHARLARGALKLARADSRIFLAMIPRTGAKSQRADDRVSLGRPTKPKSIGSRISSRK
jgi:hypothetical protein